MASKRAPYIGGGRGTWDTGPALYLWEGAFHFAVEQMIGRMVLDEHLLLLLDRYPDSGLGNTD